ncbi:MAG: DUF115 domain-containing protein [Deltaproteobacteria bacterium]|nr:MAG: DUF115 domain-containing protein [Deltaproteobacteria bacterium]
MTEPLERLCERMAHLAEVGDRFMDACLRGDAADARRWLARSRAARAQVERTQQEVERAGAPETAGGIAWLARARSLAARLRTSDEAVKLWLEQPLPPDAELLQTGEGVEAYIDAMLGATWDYDHDLVVLAGSKLEPVARALLAQGQKRIAAYVPSGDHAYPPEVRVASTHEELQAITLALNPHPPARVASKRHPDSDVTAEDHEAAMTKVERALSEVRVQFNTVKNFAPTWVAQGIANLAAVASWPSIAPLRGAFAGVPAVVVAPGPSLAKNVDVLRRLKGRALIITFSHTLKALAAADVVPDLVLCADPQDVRYHFDGVSLADVGAMINGVTVHPALFELGAPRYFTFAANSQLDDWIYESFGDEARLDGGGSVATSACTLALQLGCDPIVFAGLDLSFPGGKYYVDTSCDGQTEVVRRDDGSLVVRGWSEGFKNLQVVRGAEESRVQAAVELPGYHGGTVVTNFMLSLFHKWFEEQVAEHGDRVRFINATEGGARIAGTEQLPLAEVASQVATSGAGDVDVAAVLDRAVADLDVRGRRAALKRRLDDMVSAVDRVRSLAGRCRSLAARAAIDDGALAQLQQVEAQLSDALAPVLFVSLVAQDEIAAAVGRAQSAASVADTLAASSDLFATIKTVADWLYPLLSEARDKIS